MSIEYIINKERGIVFSKASGTMTDEATIVHRDQFSQDPLFKSSFWQLLDLTDVDDFQMTQKGIRILAERNPFSEGSRRAIVAGNDITYGMARMYQLLTDQHAHDLTVFKNMDEAKAWLGLPDDEV